MNEDLHRYAALQVLQTDYADRLVLLRPGQKLPAFKGWAAESVEPVSVARIEWAFRRAAYNLGLKVGGGLLVADYESEGAMIEARRLGVPASPMFSITARYRHEFFLTTVEGPTRIKWRGLDMDLKRSGQVMIPPSWRSDVEIRYQWGPNGMVPIADLPEFPPELLMETKPAVGLHPAGQCQPVCPADVQDRYAAAALRYEAEKVGTAKEGTRNATLNRAAFCLGSLVAAGMLPREVAEAALGEAALAAGLGGKEITATIRSGMEAGMKNPRKTK